MLVVCCFVNGIEKKQLSKTQYKRTRASSTHSTISPCALRFVLTQHVRTFVNENQSDHSGSVGETKNHRVGTDRHEHARQGGKFGQFESAQNILALAQEDGTGGHETGSHSHPTTTTTFGRSTTTTTGYPTTGRKGSHRSEGGGREESRQGRSDHSR